jgi:hypothetical protein
MSNQIPTSEEFLENFSFKAGEHMPNTDFDTITEFGRHFAKLHCEAQLKAILENASLITEGGLKLKYSDGYGDLDKDSIINAYDLNQIK